MRPRIGLSIAAFLGLAVAGSAVARAGYFETNLVSDVPGLAPKTDPNLKNPWGISASGASPIWVSNQGSGTSTLYNGSGAPQALIVTIPNNSPTPPQGPTGQVFNGTTDFALSSGGKAIFLFANLDGSISGWNGAQGTIAQIHANPSAATSYTGLALGNNGAGNFLYAADNLNGKVDVYNGTFGKTSLAGSFIDPSLPSGFSAFNVQNLGGTLYVTFEHGTLGGGGVDAFDLNGNFLRRISANGAGGPLESPWGVALAPAGFGAFAGKLLVGNEDDGRISAFDSLTGAFAGQILDSQGNAIANTGLWGLKFGNGGNGGDPNALYFAAGINGETDGLFGVITVPEPGSMTLAGLGGFLLVAFPMFKARGRRIG